MSLNPTGDLSATEHAAVQSRSVRLLADFKQDLRYGLRQLLSVPGFAAIAVLTLALGIGATAAMYSVIYAVIIDPFPYKDVDRLMSVRLAEPDRRGFRTYYTVDQFLEISERNYIFEGVIASTISDVTWTGSGEPQRLRGNHCSLNTFSVMGVPPLIGRTAGEADAGGEPVVVLGYRFWQRQFGGDPRILGRQLQLNGVVRTVIGVMPLRFMWRGADVYLPLAFQRGQTLEGVRDVHVLGRLKPGVDEARAEADLRPIIQHLQQLDPNGFPKKWQVGILSFRETFPSDIREALWILFGAVGLLLLIACVNVSNLLLSRAAGRQREMAVRAAMGAGRSRLLRQLLTESLVLAVIGGLLGIAMAYGCLRAIVAAVPRGTIPDESQIAMNAAVLLFALGISVLAAILCGLAPALQLSGRGLSNALQQAGRGTAGGARQRIVRGVLVVGEVALCVMLLVGASLMIRTLLAIQKTDPGIRADRLLTLRVPLSQQRYPDASRRNSFVREVLLRVRNQPGVAAASVNTGVHPFGNWGVQIHVAGAAQQDTRIALLHQTDEDYLKAIGLGLMRGRFLSREDVAARSHFAVVNEAFVQRYLPGSDPLGRVVGIPRLRTAPVNAADDSFQVVGVVADSLNRIVSNEILPEIYIVHTIAGLADRIVVLAHASPAALANAVRAQVYAVDREQPVMDVRTADDMINEWVYARPRFNLVLFAVFAGLGLTLVVFGVYGVISTVVAQQTREIGIRMALGADFPRIMAMVLSGGARLVGLGIVVGLAGSLASVRVLSGLVSRISTFDVPSFVAGTVVLVLAGLFASFWPARRAAQVDPADVLRQA